MQNGLLEGVVPLFAAAGSSGARLRFGSAARWAKIRNEVHRRYGWWPEVTSAGDGYRPLHVQVQIFQQRYSLTDSGWRGAGHIKTYQGRRYYIRTNPLTGRPYAVAATPGESNHGLAKAVDVANLTSKILIRWAQFADVATEFGFSNAEGDSIGEAWHWVDTLNPDDALDGSGPTTEEDMPLNQLDLEAIDRLITDRLKQRLEQPVLTQLDKEAVDALIITRVRQALDAGVSHPILTNQADRETIDGLIIGRLSQALEPLKGKLDTVTGGGVDATALAGALAPLLALSDAQVARVAKAVNDELARRLAP